MVVKLSFEQFFNPFTALSRDGVGLHLYHGGFSGAMTLLYVEGKTIVMKIWYTGWSSVQHCLAIVHFFCNRLRYRRSCIF